MASKIPGRRERNKADKLQRIRAAARELFVEQGYDGAVMRDIAARGGVGFGTIFDYASGKRDLLFLIINPELVTALNEGNAAALQATGFSDRIMRIFESFYRLYAREPTLSRYLLRELNFYRDGVEAEKFISHRSDFLDRIATLIRIAQDDGELDKRNPAELIAQIILSVFAWEVRQWISREPLSLQAGLSALRALIDLQIRGFLPQVIDKSGV